MTRFRFSLASLFGLVTFAALNFTGVRLVRVRREAASLPALEPAHNGSGWERALIALQRPPPMVCCQMGKKRLNPCFSALLQTSAIALDHFLSVKMSSEYV